MEPPEAGRAGRTLPWSPGRECGPVSIILDFRLPELQEGISVILATQAVCRLLSQRPQDTHVPNLWALAAERSTLLCSRLGGLAAGLFPLRPGPSAAPDTQAARSDLSPSPLPPPGQDPASHLTSRQTPPPLPKGWSCLLPRWDRAVHTRAQGREPLSTLFPHTGRCPRREASSLVLCRAGSSCSSCGGCFGDEGLRAPWRAQGPRHSWARSCPCRAGVHDADSAGACEVCRDKGK